MKDIHFIAGLPRSGSTLLCNLLRQNPDLFTTGTSGMLDFIIKSKNAWNDNLMFKGCEVENGRENVFKGLMNNYYSSIHQQIVFDKNHEWCSFISLANELIDKKVKIIVTVRNIIDVLNSFEALYQKNPFDSPYLGNTDNWSFIDGRCNYWMNDGPIGRAYQSILDAVNQGYTEQLFFFDYDSFIEHPKEVMKALYDFIECPVYEHNFDNIDQQIIENDKYNGFANMHKIDNVLRKQNTPLLIPDNIKLEYQGVEFWKHDKKELNQC